MKAALAVIVTAIGVSSILYAQNQPAAGTPPAAQLEQATQVATGMVASLNKSIGIYVYPSKNQDAATQEKDGQECYKWAVQQSGVDPLNPTAVKPEEVEKGRDGSAVKGAAKGAAAGAAIGAIAGDAGKGAAIGATAGGAGGAAGRRKKQAQQEKQAQATATQKEADQITSFKKAYSACLAGKGYTVN